ncbi:MAG TPA: hypothetical protein VFL57_07895, partial [Bryobacteraceae bacterium]|nr:hypothetical protein [Bryobacteraceae bacterium]
FRTHVGAGEALLYSLSSGDPTPFPRIARTEIIAVDIQTGKRRVVFSDAGLDWLLLPAYPGGGERQTMVAAGGRIFARGMPRKNYAGGWPTSPASIYELEMDGSNVARKVFDIEGSGETGSNFRNLFADADGARAGYLTYENGKPWLHLRETSQGTLLRRIDLSRVALDCLVTNIGFSPDGQQIFFTLDTGDDDATSKASFRRVGSYMMKTDGSAPARTARISNLVAPLSGGRNLYSGPAPSSFLYITETGSKARRDYRTSATGVLDFFRVSPDGGTVAFVEEQRTYKPAAVLALIVRWLDLESGREQALPAVSTRPVVLPWVNLIGWAAAK